MASRKVTYNVPGIGNLTANLFGYTQNLYDFLDNYEHINRLRRINQLGRLRDVFQGAHHNRYEYVFLQLSLISELCQHKRGDLGLSGERTFCGKIDELPNNPSTGELLQCLVLLANMGYLEGTFSTSRAWLTFLKENQNAYTNFRKGLDPLDREIFKQIVDNYDYYKFSLIVALFQLQRYKRSGLDKVNFASNLLRTYLSNDQSDIQIIQLRKLYDSIRQIAFVTLDSLYAPVPFNLDLSSILLNFDSLIESLFIKNTTYRVALYNLEQVLQNSVYMSSDSCINTARASQEKLEELREIGTNITGITDIYHIVCPSCHVNFEYQEIKELDWHRERKLIQEYRIGFRDRNNLPESIKDEVKWEIKTREKLGVSRVRVGLLFNSRKNLVKIAFGIRTSDNIQSLKIALKIIIESISIKSSMPQRRFANSNGSNEELLLSFICKSIFGWSKRFIFGNKNRETSAILISNGRVSMVNQINEYIESSRQYLNNDEIFEVEKLRDFIEHLNYSGLTIAFVGGLKLFNENQNQESAEFDGLVVCPSININNPFAHIIEAKNYNNGVTDARNQLSSRVNAHLINELQMNVIDLNNRAAYAEINAHNN
ncbi:hypothetical protein [Cytophaga sp. FL35]|uniref:hypothetical protein n=1 Tax=Cytophaga sp. FL35 TaxID=1904456 RepID=UPI001653B018|nr:hypothetical protein [Cytophaga sp. FL35]MBC6997048.1 hypothetical protein [Cytophaga sp. FL35]